MKDKLLQQNMTGRILRILAGLCVFVLVTFSVFAIYEIGFADEDDEVPNRIYAIDLRDENDLNHSYGFATNSDSVNPIEISTKGGQINLVCVAWWDDGSSSTNPVGLTMTSSDPEKLRVDGMTITALHDCDVGEVTLTVMVTDNTETGEPLVLEVPVHIIGQDAMYVTGMHLYCDSIYYDEDYYAANGYMTIETEDDLSSIYLDFYAIVSVWNPAEDIAIEYDTREGLLSDLSDGALADIEWHLSDTTMAEVSPYGQLHPTVYGNNGIWAASSAGLDGYILSNTIYYQIPGAEQGIDGFPPQEYITFNIWYDEDSEYYEAGTFNMPTNPDLVKTVVYDENDMRHVRTFTTMYTLMSGSNLSSVTAKGYGVDLEELLIEVCGLDASQGVDAIQTLRFYDPGGSFKQMSASHLFQTRYYYPNIDIGSSAGALVVKPMLAFESWWQRGFPINENAEMTDSTCFRLLLGSTSVTSLDSVTSFSWKWVNRIDVILKARPQIETGDGGDGGGKVDDGDNAPDDTPEPEDGNDNPEDKNDEPQEEPDDNSGGDAGSGSGSGTGVSGTTGTGSGPSGAAGGGAGSDSGIAVIGAGGNSNSGDGLNGFYSDSGSVDTEGIREGAGDDTGEGADEGTGAGDSVGLGAGEDAGTGSGHYSLYQVMNPFSSDIGVVYGDNPLEPFIIPVACGTTAVGVFEGLLWFFMQRRQMRRINSADPYAVTLG